MSTELLIISQNIVDHHTLFMGKQADISEVIKYADFSQPVEMELSGDPAVTDDTPNDELVEELLYGNFTTNGSAIIELSEGQYSVITIWYVLILAYSVIRLL